MSDDLRTTRLVPGADSAYGLRNLPYGVFVPRGGAPRVGVRVDDDVVDLALLLDDAETFARPSLNAFLSQGHERWAQVRAAIVERLGGAIPADAVHPLDTVELRLPIEVADYVDFYASEHHASNLGRLFRPDNPDPLMPNWKHLPVGYHGRAASIVVSGTDIVRPSGQRKIPSEPAPVFGPSIRLDIEAELAFIVGTGNAMGAPIPVGEAEQHIFGLALFNDWSARDIQAWEYVPLGPNLGKSFASTMSAWIVPLEALAAARVPVPTQEPAVLPYLALEDAWGLDIDLAVQWNGEIVSRPPYAAMYWSPAQMLAHLTINGAPTRTGDVFASGTISGPEPDEVGSLIELTAQGAQPYRLGGRDRTFLEDGDEIVLTATALGVDGTRLGFGEARGRIVARG